MRTLVEVVITHSPVQQQTAEAIPEGCGAWLAFYGVVRGEEQGRTITALGYEAYEPMAQREMERIIHALLPQSPCDAVFVTHRIGIIPVGEIAIAVRLAARHRREALSFMDAFMDRLKQDVPIWKTSTLPEA